MGHEWADAQNHQTSNFTFMHAMRNSHQTIEEACQQTNKFIRNVAENALLAKNNRQFDKSYFLFGVALHVMQDSTSPMHKNFQLWSGEENMMEKIKHIKGEVKFPGNGSNLDLITNRAWNSFSNNSIYGFVIN